MSLHAQEQVLIQVPHLEAGHLTAVRLFHHVHDRSQHSHTYDEGRLSLAPAAAAAAVSQVKLFT